MISDESKPSSAVASLSMEGLTVTEEEIQSAKKCLRHEITHDVTKSGELIRSNQGTIQIRI